MLKTLTGMATLQKCLEDKNYKVIKFEQRNLPNQNYRSSVKMSH